MRYYKPTTQEEFLAKIEKLMTSDDFPYDNLSDKIQKDLSKVQFDFENYTYFGKNEGFSTYPVGYREIAPGFHIYFVNAGGDWEWPICFIFYLGRKDKLRAYIPEDGNAWNKEKKVAYGSDDNEDSGNTDHDDEISEEKMITEILGHILPENSEGVHLVEKDVYCCHDMERHIAHRCEQHPNGFDCPDNLIFRSENKKEYGIIIHDGGHSYIVINYCPFCGKSLKFVNESAQMDALLD
ncbi:MAG: hypothetical protein WC333_02350 [Dehalococcoidia bacterium]|jgi:hypothetical protein